MRVKSNKQTRSGNVLAWAKRVEAQRAQATIMIAITKSKEFDKIQVSIPMWTGSPRSTAQHNTLSQTACRYCSSTYPPRQCSANGKMYMECSIAEHFQRVCGSK